MSNRFAMEISFNPIYYKEHLNDFKLSLILLFNRIKLIFYYSIHRMFQHHQRNYLNRIFCFSIDRIDLLNLHMLEAWMEEK